jgi:hypothetical protein
MKTSILTLALSSILLTGIAGAKTTGPVAKKPAHGTTLNDVYSGVKFHYLDKADRLLIVNDFLKSVELEYALLPLKKKLIGLDFEKLKADAITAENNSVDFMITGLDRTNTEARDRVAFLQAKSNMEFLDRMVLTAAKFKDTHFGMGEKIPRPLIYTGVRFYRVEGKVILGSVETKLLKLAMKVSGVDYSRLSIGDQVIAIDGVDVETKISDLKKYISASSDEFADSQAIRSLTVRNVKYPEKNYMTVIFKNAGIFKLPIFANSSQGETPRVDAIAYFNKVGIPSDATNISLSYNPDSKQWTDEALRYDGYSPAKLHLNLKGLTEYLDDSKQPGMRTGYYIKNGKTYGVLQLLTFYTRNLTNGDNVQPFVDAIRGFVAELKSENVPLIFDIRRNGGGNGNLPAQVLGVLLEENTVLPGATSGFRMTSYMRQIQEASLHQDIIAEDLTFGVTMDEMKDFMQQTIDDHKDYTPMFANETVITDQTLGGFDSKIVALVSADCISACDKMAFLLKSSNRATIIGTHSNGTGAGFLSMNAEFNTKWSDPLHILDTQIPNYLFGRPGDSFATTVFEDGSEERLCSENHPTMADVKYDTTMKDVAQNNIGWLEKAVEVLESK